MSEAANNSAPSLSDAIEHLMANPELISSIASAIGTVKAKSEPATDGNDNTASDAGTPPSPSEFPDLGKLISTLSPMLSSSAPTKVDKDQNKSDAAIAHSGGRREREALLCALKPYVSDGRREAIDYIIRISQVSDILKQVNVKGG